MSNLNVEFERYVSSLIESSIVKGFLPSLISKRLSMSIDDVVCGLNLYVKNGILEVETLFSCYSCDHSYLSKSGIVLDKYLYLDESCDRCDEDFSESGLCNVGLKYNIIRDE